MKNKKTGIVNEKTHKTFYSTKGKIVWKDYGDKYQWNYIFKMLVIFWPVSLYYGMQKDRYMRKMTGTRNWAGKMKYIHILATWFMSIVMTCIWIWIFCLIFGIQ